VEVSSDKLDGVCNGCFHTNPDIVPTTCPKRTHECMERITPDMIFSACEKIIQKNRNRRESKC
ncbi:MAG: hypothetical protein N2234_09865, partial [Planctomycetota bacterium]|nr:hypothetical protein [Planctomycetota bacterium]